MPVTQPDGAIRRVLNGRISDAVFSPDGKTLYIASDRQITIMDVASGRTLSNRGFGDSLGSLAISDDGRYLAGVVDHSVDYPAVSEFYRIDLRLQKTERVQLPREGDIKGNFRDIAVLGDGSVVVTQDASEALAIKYDFKTAAIVMHPVAASYGTLIPSADRDEVMVIDRSVFQVVSMLDRDGEGRAFYVGQSDPYAGASIPRELPPVGAVSASGDVAILKDVLTVLDSELRPKTLPSLDEAFPYVAGMAFNRVGDKLYLVRGDNVFVLKIATGEVTAVYPIGFGVAGSDGTGITNTFGNLVSVSSDERYVAVITSSGLQVLDLQKIVPIAGPGPDIIDQGTDQYGYGGNDRLGAAGPQSMSGGRGDDTYYVDDRGDRVFERPNEGYDKVLTSVNFEAENVEEITFTGTGDVSISAGSEKNTITAGDGNDTLYGGGGDDTIVAKGGNDRIDGGPGADKMTGGAGNDVYIVDNAGDQVVEFGGEGIDEVRTDLATYVLPNNVENLTGTALSGQSLTGNNAANVIRGSASPDRLIGKAGDDTYYASSGDVVIEDAASGHDTVHTDMSGYVLPDNVEDLVLAFNANRSFGNALDNFLSATTFASGTLLGGGDGNDLLKTTDGNDRLDGGRGADRMIGGNGDDTYWVDNSGDEVVEAAEAGRDKVISTIDYSLPFHTEELTLAGRAVRGTGNAADNLILGNRQDNILSGGQGDDALDGGLGNDVAVFSGKRADYRVAFANGEYVVEDLRAGAPDGEDRLRGIELLRFADGDVAAHRLGANASSGQQWRLFAGDGFAGSVSPGGLIAGTTAAQDITLLESAGVAVFDSSFNRGGDIVRLAGAAGEWKVSLSGSQAVLSSAITDVFVPIGTAGMAIVFEDGVRTLRYDSATSAAKLGTQAIGAAPATISAPSQAGSASIAENSDATARIFLSSHAELSLKGDFPVHGTAQPERVDVLGGSIVFDSSFNRGGDTIGFAGDQTTFSAKVSGSNLILKSPATGEVTLPVGVGETVLAFDDGVRLLSYGPEIAQVMLDNQVITTTFSPIAPTIA